jgi:hypothetical protein
MESWTIEQGAGAPGLRVAAGGSLDVVKTSYDTTGVSVRFRGYIANPAGASIEV